MSYTFDENIVSDLHKDAYGYRPREGWWNMWAAFNADQKQSLWDEMCDDMEESIREQERYHEECLARFEKRIADAKELGASDDVTAVRWILEGDDIVDWDTDYISYRLGLSYQNPWKETIAQAASSLLAA